MVTFSDFAKVADQYTLGAVFEFIDRPDGLPGFQDEYDIDFKDVKGMDHGIMYRSIDASEVDVINSYTTDGQLQDYDLRVLEDDLSYFPPYHALPLVRTETLKQYELPLDNLVHAAFQADRAVLRLRLAAAEAEAGRAEAEDALQWVEILLGRVDLLAQGRFGPLLRGRADAAVALEVMQARLAAFERRIEAAPDDPRVSLR